MTAHTEQPLSDFLGDLLASSTPGSVPDPLDQIAHAARDAFRKVMSHPYADPSDEAEAWQEAALAAIQAYRSATREQEVTQTTHADGAPPNDAGPTKLRPPDKPQTGRPGGRLNPRDGER